ncbi:hypothetical protein E0F15_00625 [Frankia sp. B2]|uniref:hypothetical protein n=1 Tax=unclassified Frankia TaxID=2632575 RepID=UPI000460AE60|nr:MULTISPECIES: hypothetical protein [unclassified Frankia]KDA44948.1 hypothetical protein BMG523Draft_00072 [Frankia sp. BMG5.23]TFE35406.1 hypothetical protein E0F15_00625 [Frankia sp. B2]
MGNHSAGRHSRQRQGAARQATGRHSAAAPTTSTAAAASFPPPTPPRPPVAPPGELDTITGPLSVSTSARRAREATASRVGDAAQRRRPLDTLSRTGRPRFATTATTAAAGVQAGGTLGTLYNPFHVPGPASPAASHRPADVHPTNPSAGSPGRMPGAHRAPADRRSSGRVRLAAAGTVSLAGLSALVAGVALGGDPTGATTGPNAGEAPRVQYTGGTAFGSSQTQASRDRPQAALPTPSQALLAPSTSQSGLGAHPGSPSGRSGSSHATGEAYLGPGTSPIPIVPLTPRDELSSPSTSPTDLRTIAPSPTESAGAATTSPSPTDSWPWGDPTPSTSPTPTSAGGSLPFHPTPIDVTPLLETFFDTQTGATKGHADPARTTYTCTQSASTATAAVASGH